MSSLSSLSSGGLNTGGVQLYQAGFGSEAASKSGVHGPNTGVEKWHFPVIFFWGLFHSSFLGMIFSSSATSCKGTRRRWQNSEMWGHFWVQFLEANERNWRSHEFRGDARVPSLIYQKGCGTLQEMWACLKQRRASSPLICWQRTSQGLRSWGGEMGRECTLSPPPTATPRNQHVLVRLISAAWVFAGFRSSRQMFKINVPCNLLPPLNSYSDPVAG